MSNYNQDRKDNFSQRKTIKIEVNKNITCLRSLSPNRLRFEIEYALGKGTSANSFLIASNRVNKTFEGPFLIHPPGSNFEEEFITALKDVISETSLPINIVMGHINPNRVKIIKKLVKIYTKITLFCSSPGAKLLQAIWTQKKPSSTSTSESLEIPNMYIVKKEEQISLDNGGHLYLYPVPTARWPGGLIALEQETGLLMSDKFFSAHICNEDWAELNRVSTEEERRHYFDCLMAPMSSQVDTIVELIEELDIQTIAPGHGPAIEGSWRSLLNDYRKWGESQSYVNSEIALLFASAYGNTAAIADALAQGITKTGIKVNIINCEFTSPADLIKFIKQADGYLIGSPTLGGHAPTPIISALGTLLAEGDRTKPAGVFGSYGWSGEALDLLEKKLKDGGFKFGFETIKIKFSPNPSMIKTLEETGTFFGRNLIKTKQRQERRANSGLSTNKSDPSVIALGRVVGSLCILTTQKEEEAAPMTGAMVASWVSQASFSPPGITIAIAKDRAVETMLHKGNSFALNILEQSNYQPLLRQFLQSFNPGEDRFTNMKINHTPGNNQPIIPEALAWLEGIVSQRMECGDHWILYAHITDGKVMKNEGVTAIHHRKSGANY